MFSFSNGPHPVIGIPVAIVFMVLAGWGVHDDMAAHHPVNKLCAAVVLGVIYIIGTVRAARR